MKPFTFDQPLARVVFGFGTRGGLDRELDRLGAIVAGTFAGAVTHTPVAVTAGVRPAARADRETV